MENLAIFGNAMLKKRGVSKTKIKKTKIRISNPGKVESALFPSAATAAYLPRHLTESIVFGNDHTIKTLPDFMMPPKRPRKCYGTKYH